MSRKRGSRGKSDRPRHSFVYERDEWQCRMLECLCPDGRAINPVLRGTDDPWAPSVDHIVELASDGPDDVENLRAAHRRCNTMAASGSFNLPLRRRYRPRPGLSYRIGDVFPGDQGSGWS